MIKWIPKENDPTQNYGEDWKRKSRRKNRRIRKSK